MDYKELMNNARKVMKPNCRVCPDCNGIACKGEIPGLGGKGSGHGFIDARNYFKSVKLLMDLIHDPYEVDSSIELFGKKLSAPFFLAPIGGMAVNYNGYFKENEYIDLIVKQMKDLGSLAFTPDGQGDEVFLKSLETIKENDGIAVPTVKPWGKEKIIEKLLLCKKYGAIASACDIDSCGNLNLKNAGKKVYPMGEETLREIVDESKIPFIVKGIMTTEAALKCKDAGCYGVVISNHGGRVIDDSLAPASRVEEIRKAVGNDFKIFVDSGIRSGYDVFKCLALGADAVLIGRPFITALHGDRNEGVGIYYKKILSELEDAMSMTGAKNLKDITRDKIVIE